MSNKDDVYVANTTGVVALRGGTEFLFRAGLTKIRGDHEALKRAPSCFEPVDATVTWGPDGRRYSTQ